MSYVDLKHLLAELALEAVRQPEKAAWIAVALACAELTSPKQPRVIWRDCLKHATTLSAPFGWKPTKRHLSRLVKAGLFSSRGDLIVLAPRFVPHMTYFKRQTARVLKAIAEIRGAQPAVTPEEKAVDLGAILFNAGLFFESHEWLEGIWKTTRGPSTEFHHGLIQTAAAFYHYEKGNMHGSRTLLSKGLTKLAAYPDAYLGIDLGRLKADLGGWTTHFADGPRPADFPRMQKAVGAPRG